MGLDGAKSTCHTDQVRLNPTKLPPGRAVMTECPTLLPAVVPISFAEVSTLGRVGTITPPESGHPKRLAERAREL